MNLLGLAIGSIMGIVLIVLMETLPSKYQSFAAGIVVVTSCIILILLLIHKYI